MSNFFRGLNPKDLDEVVAYLDELGMRLEEAFEALDVTSVPAASLTDMDDLINISPRKEGGFQVWDSTNLQPVWAAGNTPTSVWVDGAGTTVHTPV